MRGQEWLEWAARGAKQTLKLRLDFDATPSMCAYMDDRAHADGIIVDLLACAGALMEDESVALVTRVQNDLNQLPARIARLERVASDLATLAAAAGVLVRLRDEFS